MDESCGVGESGGENRSAGKFSLAARTPLARHTLFAVRELARPPCFFLFFSPFLFPFRRNSTQARGTTRKKRRASPQSLLGQAILKESLDVWGIDRVLSLFVVPLISFPIFRRACAPRAKRLELFHSRVRRSLKLLTRDTSSDLDDEAFQRRAVVLVWLFRTRSIVRIGDVSRVRYEGERKKRIVSRPRLEFFKSRVPFPNEFRKVPGTRPRRSARPPKSSVQPFVYLEFYVRGV